MANPIARGLVKRKKVGFIGAGNLAQAIIEALMEDGTVTPDQIGLSNRTPGKMAKLKTSYEGLQVYPTNEELIDESDIIFLAMKPQDLPSAIESIVHAFNEDKIVISLAAGISLDELKSLIPTTKSIIRVMPNTASRVGEGVIGISSLESDSLIEDIIVELLSPLGLVVKVEEGDEFDALMVACASGTGFVFELMTYWEEWLVERGFDAASARAMTIKTFRGAALLAELQENISLDELRNQVTSKKGVTEAGLEKMRELELEGTLAMSFEKSVQRNKNLSNHQYRGK
ncbi:MAG: pyrroline-5-carboxylate reductase family protein [Bdellovibrionales bacterium]